MRKAKHICLLIISMLTHYFIGLPIYSFGFIYELTVSSFIVGRADALTWLRKKPQTEDQKIIQHLNKQLSWLKK